VLYIIYFFSVLVCFLLPPQAYNKIDSIKKRIDVNSQQVQVFNAHEKLFGWAETNFPHLAALQRT
jgi:hypothetical protein